MTNMTSMKGKRMVTANKNVNLRHNHLPQEHQNDKEENKEITDKL